MLKLFTVYDSKVGAYMPPMTFRSAAEALRVFETTVNTPDHQFAKYPADFTLFELGSFDETTGMFALLETPHSLGVAIHLVKQVSMSVNQGSLVN